jgi:formate hydrogenlyase subunit 3/multisubunit Na+/H+ antiporter MnhD subunit
MKASTLDKVTWPLIYGGILVLLLGISTLSTDAGLGWPIVVVGIALAVTGVLSIYLRSRIKD